MSKPPLGIVDGNCISGTSETDNSSFPTNTQYNAYMPGDKGAKFYNMNHECRGIAIIFGHSQFKKGTNNSTTVIDIREDCKELEECFKYLGFKVEVYHDLEKKYIEECIKRVSKMDHDKCDCLLVVVLSEGEGDIIQAYDGAYKSEYLWSNFTPDKCPSLAGKPKLFIFGMGRGTNVDYGIQLTQKKRVEFDHLRPTYRIPLYADFLFAYSTPEGYINWQDANNRSWYVKALCSELKKKAFTYDLQKILTLVNRCVALNHESVDTTEPSRHSAKQIPVFMTTFTRFLKFSPKTSTTS